tara:strand:- start:74 stop:1108 length:1035 start_codon:yes stop_codon:yes gene_type:complete
MGFLINKMGFKDWFEKKSGKATKKIKKKSNKNLKELNKLAEEIEKQSKEISFQNRLELSDFIYQEIYFKHYPEEKEKIDKKDKEWKKYKEILKKTDQIQEYKSWGSINKNKKKDEGKLKKRYEELIQKLRKYAELTQYTPPKNKDANVSKFLPKKFLQIESWEQEKKKSLKERLSISEKVSEDILQNFNKSFENINFEDIDKLVKETESKNIKREKERGRKLKEKLLKNKIKCGFCKKQIKDLKDLAIEKDKIYCLKCWNDLRKEDYERERQNEWKEINKEETKKLKKRGLTQKEINWYFRDSEDKVKMMFDLATNSQVEGEFNNNLNEANIKEAIKIIQKREK